MSATILHHILQRPGNARLVEQLSEELTGSELNTVLLEVFNRKTQALKPHDLLKAYRQNRLVQPSDLSVIETRREELTLLERFQRHGFDALELSPVAPLGSCSVVATVDQKKVLTALRNTEVLADATNAIALYYADQKQRGAWTPGEANPWMKIGGIQRHLRTQSIARPFTAHFRAGYLVTCGVDTGNYGFETAALTEHLQLLATLFRDHYNVDSMSFRLLCRSGYGDAEALAHAVRDHAMAVMGEAPITVISRPEKDNRYYHGIQFKLDIRKKGQQFEIADGGFVDWTQQLLQNKKERMVTTGFGVDLMHRLVRG